jgi:lipoic acid synthetase
LNESEPEVLANTVKKMGLRYVVITSVTRDDLEDGGAGMFMKTAGAIKSAVPDAKVEVLTPDFNGNLLAWEIISASKIDVFSHNIETVPRLYRIVRPGADYKRSLTLLNFIHKSRKDVIIKSGLMVGLGENVQEVKDALMDLKEAGCDIVTIGQYLRPSMKSLEIDRFVSDREFEEYVFFGKKIGLDFVFSGPFVRSSYRAEEVFHQIMCQRGNSSRVQD